MENKLNSAKESRNDVVNTEAQDITKFVWKGQKEDIEGVRYQGEIRMVDASDEQLSIFYKHCQSMLYNTDSNNPGRTALHRRSRRRMMPSPESSRRSRSSSIRTTSWTRASIASTSPTEHRRETQNQRKAMCDRDRRAGYGNPRLRQLLTMRQRLKPKRLKRW